MYLAAGSPAVRGAAARVRRCSGGRWSRGWRLGGAACRCVVRADVLLRLGEGDGGVVWSGGASVRWTARACCGCKGDEVAATMKKRDGGMGLPA